jgi:phage tail-like protein
VSSADSAERLLSMLPAIYREDPLVGRYLWAFEQVLLAFEQRIDTLDVLFDPMRTDLKFLPWLTSWMAFTLRADLPEEQQRKFIANVIPLYRRRGTKENLQKLLGIFVHGVPTVIENVSEQNTDAPHSFRVTIVQIRDEPDELARQSAIARALIEMEKPAHTDYTLEAVFPSIQVGKHSTVGKDTLIGSGNE